jgi:hypothetical protein
MSYDSYLSSYAILFVLSHTSYALCIISYAILHTISYAISPTLALLINSTYDFHLIQIKGSKSSAFGLNGQRFICRFSFFTDCDTLPVLLQQPDQYLRPTTQPRPASTFHQRTEQCTLSAHCAHSVHTAHRQRASWRHFRHVLSVTLADSLEQCCMNSDDMKETSKLSVVPEMRH